MTDEKKTTEDDEAEPLLSEEGGARDWQAHPWTRKVIVTLTKRWSALMRDLAQKAPGSSDPRIAALAGQIQELKTQILAMGGKL